MADIQGGHRGETERFALIGDGCRELHPAFRIPASMPHSRFGEFSHCILTSKKAGVILPEAQAPQPDHNVHEGAHNQWLHTSWFAERSVSMPPELPIAC